MAGVTADDIVASIELILGRTPDQALIDHHLALGFKNRFDLGWYMLSTQESRARTRALQRQPLFLGDRLLAHTYRDEPIYLIPTDLDVTPSILFHGRYEAHVERVIAGSIRPGDIAIDIGSNVGVHTLVIGRAVGPEGRVHAFEANAEVMKFLKPTLLLNGLTSWRGTGRVTLYPYAVTDRAGSLVLEQAPGHFGSGHLLTDSPGSDFGPEYSVRVEVPTITIDGLLGGTIERLDFLHMDIEGAEPMAVKGARALISRSPTLRIVTEWSPEMMNSIGNARELIDWLVGEGFRFWRVGGDAGVDPVPVAVADLANHPHSDMFISRQDPPAF